MLFQFWQLVLCMLQQASADRTLVCAVPPSISYEVGEVGASLLAILPLEMLPLCAAGFSTVQPAVRAASGVREAAGGSSS